MESLRVRPRVWIGLAVWLGYGIVVVSLQSLSGIGYDELGDSGHDLFFGIGVSLIVATVLLAVTTTLLGWWGPAMRDRQPSRHRWPIVFPALMALGVLINLAGTHWNLLDGGFLAALTVLLLVGFTEELTNRGILLVALRARLGEGWVWFLTSLLFGALHLVNIVTGQAVSTTLTQVVTAALSGTTFYLLRRTTGRLWPAMLLHGFWDCSVFASTVGPQDTIAPIGNVLDIVASLGSLATVALVIRGAHERTCLDSPPAPTDTNRPR